MCSTSRASLARGGFLLVLPLQMACSIDGEAPLPTECGSPATPVHVLQGSGERSPHVGEVHRVEAVVTARLPGLRGFYLQEEPDDEDQDPGTSEGIFVFEGGANLGVTVGDLLRVSGEVEEYESGGVSVTELTTPSDPVACGRGPDVPAQDLVLESGAGIAWENYEGMRVTLEGVVTETREWARFGTLELAHERIAQATQVLLPGSAARAREEADDLARIRLDDGSTQLDPPLSMAVRSGDRLLVTDGIVDHRHGAHRIQPTRAPSFRERNPRTTAPPELESGLRIAAFNVRNWFQTLDDGRPRCGPSANQACRGAETEEARALQRRKLGAVLRALDADIIALEEIENGAPQALAALAEELGEPYRALETGPIGTDVIRVALLYRSTRVRLVGDFAVLDDSVDPTFGDRRNRPVLAQTFETPSGTNRLTVAVNHWKSKGSPCTGDPDMGDGQGRCNGTRTAAARAVLLWLATDPTDSGTPDALVVGDHNSYSLEDPVRALTDFAYVDLLTRFEGPAIYTSTFEGRFGALDHALASPSLASQVGGAAVWHINADEPDGIAEADDSIFGSSDHDPVLISIRPQRRMSRGPDRAD
jgi:predicted extracellular nuclease